MQVKDIIKLACSFTENEGLVSGIENNNLTSAQSLIVDSLVNCFNLVNNEIATQYIPYLKKESFQTSSFKVYFSSFTGSINEIISVKDSKGKNIKYKIFDDYIVALANEVEIVYSVKPQTLSLSSTFTSLIPERVYAYGIAREYYFIQTLFDDANIWENRFKDSLKVLSRKKSEILMPSRRWL